MPEITLADAKLYLRLDESTDFEIDNELLSMIHAARLYMEKKTNIIWYAQAREYYPINGSVRIYDYPVNSIKEDYKTTYKNNYVLIESHGEPVTANVGFTDPDNIPDEIRNAALQLLKYWYYESEKQTNDQMVPDGVKRVIAATKRFTI